MRVTLQFHPDWPFRDGLVIEAMARDGVYRSQFETGTSNGGLTAHPGGDRWRWESRLFQGRYDDGPAAQRPVYGAVDDRACPHGGSPRFGSAYLRLRPAVIERCSFCYPDSVFEPEAVGGPERIEELLALARTAAAEPGWDPLNDYVEAHVHGGVVIDRDVEAVVLDPCFRGSAVERAAGRLGCPIEFHPGFRLGPAELRSLDTGYRGPEYAELARALAQPHGGVLTPDVIGAAARAGEHDPHALKRVWHYLACFGRGRWPTSG